MRPEGRKAGASSRTPDAVFYKRHCTRWIGVSQEKFPGIWREALRQGRLDVSLAEAIAFEEKGFSGRFGEGIGETVAEIEAGGMAAFAVVGVALASQECLLFSDRLDGNARTTEKRVALAYSMVANPAFRNDGSLDKGCGGNSAVRRGGNGLNENLESRLAENDGENGGCVQDHFGRPFSSYRRSAWSMFGPLSRTVPRAAMSMRAAYTASRLRRRRTASRRSRMAWVTAEVMDSPVSRANS